MLPSLDPHSKQPPPPYKREVWDYKTAKIDLIRNDLLNTNWESLFLGLNTDEMSLAFTGTLLSIFSRYISNKIITCNDKDAPWITSVVKSAIRRITLKFIENGLCVGENLMITTKFVKSKTQQIKPFVKLSAHIFKSWG